MGYQSRLVYGDIVKIEERLGKLEAIMSEEKWAEYPKKDSKKKVIVDEDYLKTLEDDVKFLASAYDEDNYGKFDLLKEIRQRALMILQQRGV